LQQIDQRLQIAEGYFRFLVRPERRQTQVGCQRRPDARHDHAATDIR
jgi:hypothetical protein